MAFSCRPAASPRSRGPSYRHGFLDRPLPRTPEAPAVTPSPNQLSLLEDE